MPDPAFKSDFELNQDQEEQKQHESEIHDIATRLRSDMSYDDITDALRAADRSKITEILYAAQTYDNKTLGDEISKQIQNYFRKLADDGYVPVFARKQCGG
jgi:hypothetical protein